MLYQSWGELNKQAAPGVDGKTFAVYQQNLRQHISRLANDMKTKRYRASPIKRVYIPKSNGKQRPLGLPTIDDKLVQQSVSTLLQQIWEQTFLPNSYGYRPSKSAHQAVESLKMNLRYRQYEYVVEADIKGFFDNMDHKLLLRMLATKIDDKSLLGLINQWLKARVCQPDGSKVKPESGTPQGGVISPVLANIYLHYALDSWFEGAVKPCMAGRAMLVRYADDFVCAFQYKSDAEAFFRALPKRLARFGLSVAPDKTHMMHFSQRRPSRKHCITFLGFSLYWSRAVDGKACLRRKTAKKKLHEAMNGLYRWIKFKRFEKLGNWLPSLRRKLAGWRNYFGLEDNSDSLNRLHRSVLRSLFKWLNRRSQRRSYTWGGLKQMLAYNGITPLRVKSRFVNPVVITWF